MNSFLSLPSYPSRAKGGDNTAIPTKVFDLKVTSRGNPGDNMVEEICIEIQFRMWVDTTMMVRQADYRLCDHRGSLKVV